MTTVDLEAGGWEDATMGAKPLTAFLAGGIAGVALASAIPTLAALSSHVWGGWVGGAALAQADRSFQSGYVAGVDDAVQTIAAGPASASALKRQAQCLAAHHSSLGLGAFRDWALTLTGTSPATAAALMLERGCGATPRTAAPLGTSDLYRATVIVTGYDTRSRPSGFAQALRWVLINVSGDPRLLTDPRVTALAAHADTFVASFSYADRMAGIPYHDEQGTYDRPYDLTVAFNPARIDTALASLRERPWLAERPVVVPVLTVRGFSGTSYLLSADDPAAGQQRSAFVDVARDFHITVRFPTDADFAAWGVKSGEIPAPPLAGDPREARVAGTLEFDRSLPGWVGSWRWRWHDVDYAWGVRGVNYDEAFRDIVSGVLRVASGHGTPQ